MTDQSQKNVAAKWIPLMVVGICLNTIGIALGRAGAIRFVLMGLGLLLLLVALTGMISAQKK